MDEVGRLDGVETLKSDEIGLSLVDRISRARALAELSRAYSAMMDAQSEYEMESSHRKAKALADEAHRLLRGEGEK